jgi:hypothetical protein
LAATVRLVPERAPVPALDPLPTTILLVFVPIGIRRYRAIDR